MSCCSCNCHNKKKEGFFKAFAKMDNNSKAKTIIVATLLCLVCSFAVSFVAVSLKPIQDKNNQAYKEANIFTLSGLSKDDPKALSKIKPQWVNLEKGAFVDTDDSSFDKDNPKYQRVYFINDDAGKAEKLIIPFGGKGAWGPINGFLVLHSKLSSYYKQPYNEIADILFYEQSETPGLGAKVAEPEWRANWRGKEIYDAEGNLLLKVFNSGLASKEMPKVKTQVDGISGATVTTGFVSKFTKLVLGDKGFKKFLINLRNMEQ